MIRVAVIPAGKWHSFLQSGSMGWIMVAAGIITWDALAAETLSAAFGKSRQHPAGAVAVGSLWGLITAHLFGVLPQRVDPIHIGASRIRSVTKPGYLRER